MGDYTLCRYCGSFFDSDENDEGSCSFHTKLPVMVGDAGPRYDHKDLYTFPCCGVTTLSDIDAGGRDVRPPQSPGCTTSRHVAETGWNVFLSYARTDEQWAAAVEHELRRRGHRVWRDRSDLTGGQTWAAAIDDAIRGSDHVIVFVSERATSSEQVAREVDLALELGRNVVPVLVETCEIPAAIRHVNCVDWRGVAAQAEWLPSFVAGTGFEQLREAVLFGSPTGIWQQAADVEAARGDADAAKRREQEDRRTAALRQVVIVRDARDGELLAELRLARRLTWQRGQPFAVGGASYRVADAIEHSTAAIDVVVERD